MTTTEEFMTSTITTPTTTQGSTFTATIQDSTTSDTPSLSCSERDGRMVLWEGEPWELVRKSCDEGSFENESFTAGICQIDT